MQEAKLNISRRRRRRLYKRKSRALKLKRKKYNGITQRRKRRKFKTVNKKIGRGRRSQKIGRGRRRLRKKLRRSATARIPINSKPSELIPINSKPSELIPINSKPSELIPINSKPSGKKQIIYVSHDAHFHGAQLLSVNIVKLLSKKFGYSVHVLLKKGGMLENVFAKYAKVYNLERNYSVKQVEQLISDFYRMGIDIAITSTVVSGDIVPLLNKNNIRTIALVHELPGIINQMNMEENAGLIAEYAHKVVFPAKFVRDKFSTVASIDDNKVEICPQGLFKVNKFKNRKQDTRVNLRKQLNLNENAKIVLGVGYADHRKGVDLFVDVAREVTQKLKDTFFVWVGNKENQIYSKIEKTVQLNNLQDKIMFIETWNDVSEFFAGSDLYLLTSREDPFPCVVLEAMDAGLPVVGFENAGGFVEIINPATGVVCPYLDVNAMSEKVIYFLENDALRNEISLRAPRFVSDNFNFNDYVYKLLELLGHSYKKVSVIIPNYNYEHFLTERLNSIFTQTYPIYEYIFLDDCSTDQSVELIKKYCSHHDLEIIMDVNEFNSQSTASQWIKGISLAKGDYIWIAEADDLCHETFLSEVMKGFNKDNVIVSYCQSKQITETGEVLAQHYLDYTNDINDRKWLDNYNRKGLDEIRDTLIIKNTLPNISGVVFKKISLAGIVLEIKKYKFAHDWFLYLYLLQFGDISFCAKPLNYHRRHSNSLIHSGNKKLLFDEIVQMQEYTKERFEVNSEIYNKALKYRAKVHDYLC